MKMAGFCCVIGLLMLVGFSVMAIYNPDLFSDQSTYDPICLREGQLREVESNKEVNDAESNCKPPKKRWTLHRRDCIAREIDRATWVVFPIGLLITLMGGIFYSFAWDREKDRQREEDHRRHEQAMAAMKVS